MATRWSRARPAVAGSTLLILAWNIPSVAVAAPALSLPVDCTPGADCWLVRYMDHDSGSGVRDYACGELTGDGHKGTDIGIRDLVAMAEGVRVQAAAAGTVVGVRDGMPDRSVEKTGLAAIEGRECGNGVRLDHGNGWTTQYCHMRRASVRVEPGDRVEAGQTLGLVGLSGETSFPHVHFEVAQDGQPVDPFVGPAPAGACGPGDQPLWTPGTLARLDYQPALLVAAGFATAAPDAEDVRAGRLRQTALPVTSPALVVWVDGFWFERGDRLSFRLTGPGDEILLDQARILEDGNRRYMGFAGRKRPDGQWPAGTYRARVLLERPGARPPLRISLEREVVVR